MHPWLIPYGHEFWMDSFSFLLLFVFVYFLFSVGDTSGTQASGKKLYLLSLACGNIIFHHKFHHTERLNS